MRRPPRGRPADNATGAPRGPDTAAFVNPWDHGCLIRYLAWLRQAYGFLPLPTPSEGGVAPGVQWQGGDAYAALSARVDLTNYVDYLIANWYAGNTDWPNNNWMATAHARLSADPGNRNPDGRFIFHVWDAEATLY